MARMSGWMYLTPVTFIHMSKVWSKSISIIRHCHASFLQEGGKWNPQSWQGLTISSCIFAIFRNLQSQVQGLSGVSILFELTEFAFIILAKITQFTIHTDTKLPNLDHVLWNFFCKYFSTPDFSLFKHPIFPTPLHYRCIYFVQMYIFLFLFH